MTATIQELTDQYYAIRKMRLEKDKEAKALASKENEWMIKLILAMKEAKLYAVGVADVTVRYKQEDVPTVVDGDWPLVWGHIQSTGEFELLNKRLTVGAVRERWDEGREVPGVIHYPRESLIVTPR